MGRVKELMQRLLDVVVEFVETGKHLRGLNEYVFHRLDDEDEYRFYIQNKKAVLDMAGVQDDERDTDWRDSIRKEERKDRKEDPASMYEFSGKPGRPTRAEVDPEHDLATTFKSWKNHYDPEEYAELLFGILVDRHPRHSTSFLRSLAYRWVGLKAPKEPAAHELSYVAEKDQAYLMPRIDEGCNCTKKNRPKTNVKKTGIPFLRNPLRKKLHETRSFTRGRDPAEAMGVGLKAYLKEVMDTIADDYDAAGHYFFGTKPVGGGTNVIYKTIEGIVEGKDVQAAFFDACEDENFYGDRQDIVEYRKLITDVLRDEFGLRVDHVFESSDHEYLMDSIHEVDYGYLAKKSREGGESPRYAGGYSEFHAPEEKKKSIGKPDYNYDERREGLSNIAVRHEIMKDMGYDLDTDEEDPAAAPSKRELSKALHGEEPSKFKEMDKEKITALADRFNELKDKYYVAQIGMDKIHRRHAKNKN